MIKESTVCRYQREQQFKDKRATNRIEQKISSDSILKKRKAIFFKIIKFDGLIAQLGHPDLRDFFESVSELQKNAF